MNQRAARASLAQAAGTRMLDHALPLLVILPTAVVLVGLSRLGLPDPAALAFGGLAAVALYALPLRRWWLRRIRTLGEVRS